MKRKPQDNLDETLAKDHECYVLITCGKPCKDGNMDVEMSYNGDPALASYLLQGAQTLIDEQQDGDDCLGL